MGEKLFSQLSEPFVGLMDAPLQPPHPQTAHSAGADFLPFTCAGLFTLICAWPQSDSRGRNLHRGDKAQQLACIYLSPRG